MNCNLFLSTAIIRGKNAGITPLFQFQNTKESKNIFHFDWGFFLKLFVMVQLKPWSQGCDQPGNLQLPAESKLRVSQADSYQTKSQLVFLNQLRWPYSLSSLLASPGLTSSGLCNSTIIWSNLLICTLPCYVLRSKNALRNWNVLIIWLK